MRAEDEAAERMPHGRAGVVPGLVLAAAWLALLTVLGFAASFRGLLPLDARSGEAVADARLEMPLWTSAIEPVLAPFQIVVGASNYQAAAKSTACWIFAGVLAGFLVAYRRRSKSLWAVQIGNSVLFASGYTLLFVLYMLAAVLIPLPSWSLVMKDPANAIVADLHSHTIVSQDGIVSKEQNLAVHQSRGYDVVALTEHHPVERWIRVSADSHSIETIAGVEFGARIYGREYYFLLLGVSADAPIDDWFRAPQGAPPDGQAALRNLIARVHEANGVVLALAMNLRPVDVEQFIAAGLDGFEIVNFGHPEFTAPIGATLIAAQKAYGIALVATSDWHGWSGMFKTWTVFRLSTSPGNKADQVMDALRRHESGRIVPVVSQMFEQPSALRVFLAPFAEAVRYGGELSVPRLASWWVWTVLVVLAVRGLRRMHLNPVGAFVTAAQTALGICVIARGAALVALWLGEDSLDYPLFVGSIAMAAGALALAIAWINRCFLVRSIVASPWIRDASLERG